jgi:hypothetical protein
MKPEVYLSWLITSTISLSLSLVMITRILSNSQLRSKIFHQLMLLLVIGEIFIAISWFLGNKSHNSYQVCSLQEYLLQLGLLFRAGITVILCYLSSLIIVSLTIPTWRHILQILGISLSFILITLACSIYFQTANVFCHKNPTKLDETLYAALVLAPIYGCLVFDLILYLRLRSKVYQFYHSSSPSTSSSVASSSLATTSASSSVAAAAAVHSRAPAITAANMSNLLNISQQLLRYPILYALLLFPEVLYSIYVFLNKHPNIYFSIIASSSMGITGGLLALRYIFRHDPSLLSLAPVLYSSQIQSLFRFTNFASINFSFRKRQTQSGRGTRGEGGVNGREDSNPQSLPSSFIARYGVESSAFSHMTDTSPHLQSSNFNSVDSRLSPHQVTKFPRTDEEIAQDHLLRDQAGSSSQTGFWSAFFSPSHSTGTASYEFTHSRSVSGASDRTVESESPHHHNIDPNSTVLSTSDFL